MATAALLVDLDGTVWDSAPWYAALLHEDREKQARLARSLATPGGGANVAQLLKEAGFTASRLRRACRSRPVPRLYAGALESLREHRSRSGLVAAVTNLPAWIVEPLAECTGLADVLDHAETAHRGVPGKPKPHLLLRALAALGVDATDAHVVGDSVADWQAATAAGVLFTWAAWGYGGTPPDGVLAADSWGDVVP